MDLFDYARQRSKEVPLAHRLRPLRLEDFVGQEHLTAPGRILSVALKNDQIFSAIFYGPPGTGKTSLAGIIARSTSACFVQIDASNAGVSEVRKILQDAKDRLKYQSKKTVLFIDEIHRFNKAQQDVLLPAVEQGSIILIGATTENPYFSINAPLLSRLRVLPFYPLQPDHLRKILEFALNDSRGLNGKVQITSDGIAHLMRTAEGDARILLNTLETAVKLAKKDNDGFVLVGLEEISEAVLQRTIYYDRDGDMHYDVISAFIKSMRGSDPDATIYWLARMLKAGEDPRFIARRIIICAAEDVGLADPNALVVAEAATQGLERVGMPEGRLLLAEAALYVACAPKSNRVYKAISAALQDVENLEFSAVPGHLRDANYRGARELGRGKGYLYPHDFPKGFVSQQYLPDVLIGRKYYEPTEHGFEKDIKVRLESLCKTVFEDF